MRASVFIEAFSECLVSLAMARKYPSIKGAMRSQAVLAVIEKHGATHAEATGRMFDKLWDEARAIGGGRK